MEIFEAAELVKLNDGTAGVNNICCQYFLYIVFLRKILLYPKTLIYTGVNNFSCQ